MSDVGRSNGACPSTAGSVSSTQATPTMATKSLPPALVRAKTERASAEKARNIDSDSRGNVQRQESDNEQSTAPPSAAAPSEADSQSPPRPLFSRLSTFPDQRVLESPEVRNRPAHQWRIPKSAKGNRAATLFLGKDYERWEIHDRDNLGLKLAWKARPGSSSDLPLYASDGLGSTWRKGVEAETDDDEDEDTEGYSDPFTTDNESEPGSSLGASVRSSRRSSRSSRSRSGSGNWKKGVLSSSVAALHPLSSAAEESLHAIRSSSEANQPSASSKDISVTQGPSYTRRRRYSSNGPEASIHRHETVIGLHTPRRDSTSSGSSSSFAGRQLPSSVERISLAPLSQITPAGSQQTSSPLPSGTSSRIDPANHAREVVASPVSVIPSESRDEAGSEPSRRRKSVTRKESSFDLLKRAAEAAAASVEPSSESEVETLDESHLSSPSSPTGRSISPRPQALRLARRRKPIRVDGTLYDRSGPFREGAVTDGLSVRLFSAEHLNEEGGYDDGAANGNDSSRRHAKSSSSKHSKRRGTHRRENNNEKRSNGQDSAIDDEDESSDDDEGFLPKVKDAASATTYLITTPDNRVSSAAKLRRWAMDGSGNFYAAMEIKSVEAKLRSAVDPNDADTAENAAYTRSLAKILRQTYLDDILNEVQKAETLNPGRNSVAKLLVTSDHKYVRLEEDYPEETFFVIAGCEEEELYPVVAMVFCQALRLIHQFHTAGWMHGDIKLENLMFDSRGELVVIDYENANPYRVPGGDGCVSLMSFDWVPPEAAASPDGRRAGPSADLWALGANLVRAFALRDGIEDSHIRSILLEGEQQQFLRFRDSLITVDEKQRRATASDVNLDPILDAGAAPNPGSYGNHQDRANGNGHASSHAPKPNPPQLLYYFARAAPHLLRYVLASCLTMSPSARNLEAELEGLRLATAIESERDGATMRLAKRAVGTAIQLSGSEWVRPKLDEARRNLGLGSTDEPGPSEPAVCIVDEDE